MVPAIHRFQLSAMRSGRYAQIRSRCKRSVKARRRESEIGFPPSDFPTGAVNLLQKFLHDARSLGEIHLARIFFLQDGHDLAHVPQALCASFRDRRLNEAAHLFI